MILRDRRAECDVDFTPGECENMAKSDPEALIMHEHYQDRVTEAKESGRWETKRALTEIGGLRNRRRIWWAVEQVLQRIASLAPAQREGRWEYDEVGSGSSWGQKTDSGDSEEDLPGENEEADSGVTDEEDDSEDNEEYGDSDS
jgi:hypothetical protein